MSVSSSRIGSAELYESRLSSVHFVGCKLGYLNLRGSILTDLVFTDCTIDELDLGGATAERVAFIGTETRVLDVTRATLAGVDLRGVRFSRVNGVEGLRGATMDELQIAELANVFAAQLGIEVAR